MATRAKMKQEAEGQTIARAPTTFEGMIAKDFTDTAMQLLGKVKQDTGRGANTSRILAELFMWNWIRKYSESQYNKLLKDAKADGVVGNVEELGPGNHILAESRHFVTTANVTEPVRRFSPDALCEWALEKFKIPVILMKEAIEKAKQPSSSTVRITITERE